MNLPASDVAEFLLEKTLMGNSTGVLGGTADWSLFTEREPPTPNRSITVFSLPQGVENTTSRGRTKTMELVGVQFRVRGASDAEVWGVLEAIRDLIENKGFSTDPDSNGTYVRYKNFTVSLGPVNLGRTQNQFAVWVVTCKSLREQRLG